MIEIKGKIKSFRMITNEEAMRQWRVWRESQAKPVPGLNAARRA